MDQGGGKRRAGILAVEIKPGIVFYSTEYGNLFPHLFASCHHCGGKRRSIIDLVVHNSQQSRQRYAANGFALSL